MTRTLFSQNADTRYGKLKAPDLQHDLIGRFLDYYGEWAFNEVRFCASLLKDGARVLDIGAFIGTFGLGVASLRRLTSLCAVEGNPELIPFLNANISLAAERPTTSVINAIVAPPGYEVHGHCGEEKNLGSTSFVYEESMADVPDDVPVKATLTLTELRKQNGPFDLIKIDAEGMEYAILKDDWEFVATGDSLIWIECNEEISSLDCADLLLGLGLTVHYFAFPAHNFENYRSQTKPLLPWAYEAGLLASRNQTISELDEILIHNLCILKTITSRTDLRRALWETPRWTPPEWPMTHSSIQLAAIASRQVRKQSYDTFLINENKRDVVEYDKDHSEIENIKFRLNEMQEALESTKQLAFERLNQIHEAEAHIQRLNTVLNDAREILQTSRQSEANLRQQLEQTQDGLNHAQTLAYERLNALELAEIRHQESIQTEVSLWQRLEQTEIGLAEAQKLAFERLKIINGMP